MLNPPKKLTFTGILNKRFKGHNPSSPVIRPFIRAITPFLTAGATLKGSLKLVPMFTLKVSTE